eukprot:TRINITY_DN7513_c0_g1_i2.p3 TRINITY_DN7513_c0_g1~~TRINITY_DN7513_c0_g1_i2.p3  ORF type:complete len:167 (-),score=3.31 TRINITY_DN7513_c0_g1_i2:172-603(-)
MGVGGFFQLALCHVRGSAAAAARGAADDLRGRVESAGAYADVECLGGQLVFHRLAHGGDVRFLLFSCFRRWSLGTSLARGHYCCRLATYIVCFICVLASRNRDRSRKYSLSCLTVFLHGDAPVEVDACCFHEASPIAEAQECS